MEVSAVLSDLLLEQGERRTFPGVDLVREGASNLNDDIHKVLSDILDGVDDNDYDYEEERENNFIRQTLRDDENKILKALRELEAQEERERRPIRFGDQNRNPLFSDEFGEEGLRSQIDADFEPNLNNRGRFNPSRPRQAPVPVVNNDRAPRQQGDGGE